MKLQYSGFLLVLLPFLMISCDIINPPEQIPSYVAADSAILQTNTTTQGSNAHYISDAWLYVDKELIGVFEMPFSVPVLAAGAQSIEVQAGIKKNGVAASRVVYPYFTKYKLDTVLTEAQILNITPRFSYNENVTFALIEDFEDLGIAFEVSSQSDTNITIVSDEQAFQGNSMHFALDSVRSVFEARTTELYELPYNRQVYLEMCFKTTDYVTFGMFARKYSGGAEVEVRIPIITLNPTERWKTIYVSLTETINSNPSAYDFRLYFTCARSADQENEITEVFIDNIKLLY